METEEQGNGGFESWDNPFERMVLDDQHCFLCGNSLERSGTREHIFPGWLQHRHDLWNQELNLLNRTSIAYRQLTVPCCSKCNNEDLAYLERTVHNAFENGYEAVASLNELILFQWAGKIFFGLLFKELGLLYDRSDPKKGTIISKKFLAELDVLHGLLQSIYRPVEFIGDPPFSVLVAHLHDLEPPDDFDFHDELFNLTISVQSSDVGVIVALEDARINADSYGRYLEEVAGRQLHPIQFDELFAKVTYNTKRLSRAPTYTFVIPDDPSKPFQVAMRSGVWVGEWVQAEFVPIIRSVWSGWGIPEEELYRPPNLVRSMMETPERELLLLDREARPLE